MNKHLEFIYHNLEKKYYYQKEYLSTVKQFLESISDYLELLPDYQNLAIIERLVEPDRIITFKVPWVDDSDRVNVNTGWRVQHSNLIGVYKGGIRFSPTVNESVLKFLAFEQTFKNSLTDLPLGGAKGGSDFNPLNKSDNEILRFCQNYMLELSKYIGLGVDVPAGDLGVSAKEIGYMYGMYKKITNNHFALTSKSEAYGGSLMRPESTGYGVLYIANQALDLYYNKTVKDMKVIISGIGQVGINAGLKAISLGARVIAISNSKGILYNEEGLDLALIQANKTNNQNLECYLQQYPKTKYFEGAKKLWQIKTDIAIPCATQNELDLEDAKTLISNGLKLVVEGANKPATNQAINEFIENKVLFIPSKLANAGGVIVSSLEIQQNTTTSKWTFEEVDNKLKVIVNKMFNNVYKKALELNDLYNLEKAANITAFKRLYEAMKEQGV